MARFLVVRESAKSPSHVLLLDAHDVHIPAAQLFRADPRLQIISVRKRPARAMQLGVLPTFEDYTRARLAESDVPPERYIVLDRPVDSPEELVQAIEDWLADRPSADMIALCDYFAGRSWRTLFDDALPPESANRIHIVSQSRPEYDETNWWSDKEGVIEVLKRGLACFEHGSRRQP